MVKDFKIDRMLIAAASLLILFGLIMIYSSTMIIAKEKCGGDSFFYLKKQLGWFLVGMAATVLIASAKYPFYLNRNVVFAVLFLSIAGLLMVFVTGKINNSCRWIRIAGFSVQPSEFAKIASVMYLAYILGRKNFDVNDIRRLVVLLLPFFIVEVLIIKEPDLGNFILLLLTAVVMLFVAGLRVRYFLYSLLALIPALYMVLKFNPDRLNRLTAFLNPDAYAATYNFQVHQSIYAIGSGGIFGKGLGNSTQKLFYLPYAYSDFIFAVIGEEVGLVGSAVIIALFFTFMVRGINVARYSGNLHTYLLVIGLTFMIVIQAMINISVTLGIFPTKGIPLPFISNGGTSLVACMIVSAIILNVSRHRKTVLLND
ncbi:MAG: putative lipid II flippase FtsW [Candidatus Omnitrophota bacterium]